MPAFSRTRLILSLLPFLFASAAAFAAPAEPLLPVQLGPWRQEDWQRVEAPELERLAGPQAALLREYGARRAEQASYGRGQAQWQVTVYEMQDRSSAYGTFSLLRAGGRTTALGEAGVRQGEKLTFYQGNYFVRVDGHGGAAELGRLAHHLEAQAGPQASLPTLPSYLPQEGFVAGSDRYLLGPLALAEVAPLAPGDWAGFAYGAEAETARYRLGSAEAILLIVSYPTPQIAVARLRDFERLFNLNGQGEPQRLLAFAKRSGTLLLLVAGAVSPQEAATLLDRVRYEAEIAWSGPSTGSAPQNWAMTIVGLLMGTGLFLAYALLSGLAFGAVRLVVKRLLPGRVFDRPEDTEIIRLDLDLGP